MSTHIGAQPGQIADTVLMPGDPLRAKFVAENFLTDVVCYNEVRGMYGFTGTYKGKRVSVQGSGMGMPSISIYVSELFKFYDVKNVIRIGTCGAYSPKLKVRDIVLAMSASTDSAMNRLVFDGMDFAPTASFVLLRSAVENAEKLGLAVNVGGIMSSDTFYNYKPDTWKVMAEHGVLAVEMETAALYTLAARYGKDALTILTVSDHLVTGEVTTAEERQSTFSDMMKIALETAK